MCSPSAFVEQNIFSIEASKHPRQPVTKPHLLCLKLAAANISIPVWPVLGYQLTLCKAQWTSSVACQFNIILQASQLLVFLHTTVILLPPTAIEDKLCLSLVLSKRSRLMATSHIQQISLS
jgi:hypothetical protein